MSKYQYYEFQAVDEPLTRQQMSELRGYSTRAEITPTRFVNSYFKDKRPREYPNLYGNRSKLVETGLARSSSQIAVAEGVPNII